MNPLYQLYYEAGVPVIFQTFDQKDRIGRLSSMLNPIGHGPTKDTIAIIQTVDGEQHDRSILSIREATEEEIMLALMEGTL